jgi:23S rRNA (uracil1939-C5)-methyltransferase
VEQLVQRGEVIKLYIDKFSQKGEGLASVKGYPIYVIGGLPGDEGEVRIISVRKEYARGELVSLLKPSELRVPERCSLSNKCGGCGLQHLDYRAQLDWKTEFVRNQLAGYEGLKDVPVLPALGMDNPWEYRNKIQYPLGQRQGRIISGFYAKRSHELIQVDHCFIQNPLADEIKDYLLTLLEKGGISIYDEKTDRGQIRHLLIRIARRTGQVMVVFITREKKVVGLKEIGEKIRERFPAVVSVQQNINNLRGNVILGRETRLLSGVATITDYIGELAFKISPRSFFQVNPIQTEILYGKALEYAKLTGEETVLDAYCGIGTISLFLARRAKRVIGIELVEEAIDNARENAQLNGIENAEFIVGDVTEVMPRLYNEGIRPQVIVVDPPRKGCTREVLDTFGRMNPERIVYVSCNPVTLARDLDYLSGLGYRAVEVQPVDMFPQGGHVETVVLMSRL